MRLTKELIEEMMERMQEKKGFYNDVQFDKFGRVAIGQIQSDRDACLIDWINNLHYKSRDYVNHVMAFAGWSHIGWYNVEGNLIRVEDLRGRPMNIKISKFLNKFIQWYKEEFDAMDMGLNEMRIKLERILAMKDDILYMSINPLDFLTASGSGYGGDREIELTTYSSCIGTRFFTNEDDDNILDVHENGCYSNPETLLTIGSIHNRVIFYTRNSNEYSVCGYPLHGYKARAFGWFDGSRVFLETVYPSKSTTTRRVWANTINQTIRAYTSVNDVTRLDVIDWCGLERFNAKYQDTYLDYSAIDEDGIYLLPLPRGDYNTREGWDVPDTTSCVNCGCSVCDDGVYEYEGDYYCSDCFCDLFTWCTDCEDVVPYDDALTWDDEPYCEYCFNQHTNGGHSRFRR